MLCCLGLLLCLPKPGQAAGDIEVAGDILQVAIPLLGYAATFYADDEEGRSQFYQSFFTTVGVTQVLKRSINKQRPNGGDYSFPSGHTSAAFQGAAFIHARYGTTYAIPAYIAASFVGYSRVESKNHWTSDVLAGAALGTACSFYFTTPNRNYVVQPIADNGYYGLQISGNW